jgi:serine/threonine protein phosphatase 1
MEGPRAALTGSRLAAASRELHPRSVMRHASVQPGQPPRVPDGERVYAVGDIHGRDDLLGLLHRAIAEDMRRTPQISLRTLVVYLGDYIDRGPCAADVLERLIHAPLPGCRSVHLRGNHEDMMLDFLDSGTDALWLANGGGATLASYGIDADIFRTDIETLQRLRLRLQAALPARHLQFLRGLADYCCCGDYFFVHAGVRPGRPLDDQDRHDLTWIRGPFLASNVDFGKRIVHGHTIVTQPEVRTNRIGIDTGACFSGRLTCLVLEHASMRFLHT